MLGVWLSKNSISFVIFEMVWHAYKYQSPSYIFSSEFSSFQVLDIFVLGIFVVGEEGKKRPRQGVNTGESAQKKVTGREKRGLKELPYTQANRTKKSMTTESD